MRKLKIRFKVLCCLSVCFFSMMSFAQSSKFDKKIWQSIQQQNLNENWIAVFWSLECPPCFKELQTISGIIKSTPDLKLVLINTDADNDMKEKMDEVINKYQLNDLTLLHFADEQASQNRYIIDPTWYGELPRSYFFNRAGQSQGRSGLVDKNILQQWLK
ncbi:hypothetical protein [Pseudoalteromonas sp. NBT06-2]|uniref:hypothetical protein n=1 Tax=Pseudoalteromonas sp. NBT06-2 TaxID=2025950 RepID=UPI001140BA74|nr:hypothetical protein [Pseudoalteromonas sp. NBT06-2]